MTPQTLLFSVNSIPSLNRAIQRASEATLLFKSVASLTFNYWRIHLGHNISKIHPHTRLTEILYHSDVTDNYDNRYWARILSLTFSAVVFTPLKNELHCEYHISVPIQFSDLKFSHWWRNYSPKNSFVCWAFWTVNKQYDSITQAASST